MQEPGWLWGLVLGSVLGLILLDTFVFGREERGMPLKEAVIVSIAWIVIALTFGLGVLVLSGRGPFEEYITAYLIEKGLAFDNVFVFSLIFAYFAVPKDYEHRVLFDPWGVTVALVTRIALILAGIAFLEHFKWSTYVLGALVVLIGLRLMMDASAGFRPDRSLTFRALRLVMPVLPEFAGRRFFTRVNGRLCATQLMVVLLAIETCEMVFSFDSVPTVLGVTDKAFLIWSSNAFAILGLRSLYFVLSGMSSRFSYVRTGVSVAVILIGLRLLLSRVVHVDVWVGLAVTVGLIVTSVVASLLVSPRPAKSETMTA